MELYGISSIKCKYEDIGKISELNNSHICGLIRLHREYMGVRLHILAFTWRNYKWNLFRDQKYISENINQNIKYVRIIWLAKIAKDNHLLLQTQ